jgi:hypothetical protein
MNALARLPLPMPGRPRNRRPWARLAPITLVALVALAAGCGGGEGSSPAAGAAPAANGDRSRALAAPTSLAVSIPQVADPALQNLTIPANAATQGMWGSLQAWPMNAIHAALLPDGRLLSYGAPQNQDVQDGRTFDVWNPTLGFGGDAHATSFEAGRNNSFCSTAEWLPDGRLLISGGNGARGSQLFSPATSTAANDGAALADDRWYATMLGLPDGRAVMLGGIDPYTEGIVRRQTVTRHAITCLLTAESLQCCDDAFHVSIKRGSFLFRGGRFFHHRFLRLLSF